MAERDRKTVSFNPANEKEKQMLKHLKRRNFSGYVKKLIEADMKSKGKWEDQVPQDTKEVKKEEKQPNKFDELRKQIKKPSSAPGPYLNQPKG